MLMGTTAWAAGEATPAEATPAEAAPVEAITAAPAAAAPARPVVGVDVEGNKRTAHDVIVALAAVDRAQPLDDVALAEIRQRVMNSKLFERVELIVRESERGPVLVVRVVERWTLFPIPFVSSSSRGTQGGVYLLDTNLFGRNKLIVAGGSYASWGGAGFALYQDPSVAGTRATLRASLSYAQTTRERRRHDEVVQTTDDTRGEVTLLAGYRVARTLWLSAGWFAAHTRDEPGGDAPVMTTTSGYLSGPTAMIEYRNTNFKMYYDEGLSGVVQYKQARKALGADRDVLDIWGRAQYTRALLPGQSTTAMVQGYAVHGGDRLADVRLLGGATGTRGFELQSLWVDRAATATLEHQIPVVVRGWGIWTANGFVDVGRVSLGGTHQSFATPGAGVRLYLPRMNFPAVGFDLAYSLDVEKVFASVSVGMSM